MKIEKLSLATVPQWLEFFDKRAFADHADWQGCYCTFYFQPKPEGFGNRRAKRREYAVWLIEKGIMRGYLAFEGDHAVGWCNANDRAQFGRLAPLSAKREGYTAVEAYPQRDSKSEFRNFHGPYGMYTRLGFQEVAEHAHGQLVVRRSL